MRNFHWQNLNEQKDGLGHPFWHGRCWLPWAKFEFMFSWNFRSHFCHFYVEQGDCDHNLLIGWAIPPVAFWLGVTNHSWFKKVLKTVPLSPNYPNTMIIPNKEWGFSWHDNSIWLRFGGNPNEWSKGQPWWHEIVIHGPSDWLFGKAKYSEREISQETRWIKPFPNEEYSVHIRLYEAIWKRPRWPFPKKVRRADVEAKEGIPIPGKGENSWDLDDTAVWSSTCNAHSAQEAIHDVLKFVKQRRERYGCPNWQPEM